MTPVRLEPAAPRSRAKHSTTEPLRSLNKLYVVSNILVLIMNQATAQCKWLEPLALSNCLIHGINECATEAIGPEQTKVCFSKVCFYDVFKWAIHVCHVKCLVLLSRNSMPNLIEIQKLRNENKRKKIL